ncbi:MAG: zf-HC2 domain-containing protein [Chloroflexi bacterium]|nr:zf-HC2 domain-containing protein [Chloroflexota bacterium]
MDHLTDSQLNEYLDDMLDETTRRKFDSHLQTCEDCAARLDELRFIFTSLAELPEARLTHDLSANVLSRLPQKQPRILTPFFAAQAGAALGVLFWLSTQVARFIPPVPAFKFSQFQIPTFQLEILHFQFPDPYSLFTFLHHPFSIPTFQPSTFNLSSFNIAFIAISVFLLWLVGNLFLLRNRREVQK